MKLDWNFQTGGGGGGGGGPKEKSLLWGRYGKFLEPHNDIIIITLNTVGHFRSLECADGTHELHCSFAIIF